MISFGLNNIINQSTALEPKTEPSALFKNRIEAGRQLAKRLAFLKGGNNIVLALPRGGVVIGREVANYINSPLDIVSVNKITDPFEPDKTIGAVVDNEPAVYDKLAVNEDKTAIVKEAEAEARKLAKTSKDYYYQGLTPPGNLTGKTVIIVDDGISSSLPMEASIKSTLLKNPKNIIVATPVASAKSLKNLEPLASMTIVLENPDNFKGMVGFHYLDFSYVEADEVQNALQGLKNILRQPLFANY